jgi:hypothetical protein
MTNQQQQQQRDGQGCLFKNERKSEPTHADYNGTITVNGTQYWLNGWVKEARNGNKFLSLAIKPKLGAGRPVNNKSELNDSNPF